jgi:ligand-binding sensor protein
MEHISAWSMLMMFENISTIKKNTEICLKASKEVGLEANTGKPNIWLCLVTKT